MADQVSDKEGILIALFFQSPTLKNKKPSDLHPKAFYLSVAIKLQNPNPFMIALHYAAGL